MSCEYCENLGRNKGIYAEVFEQIAADDSREVVIPANFCPTCGEPLTAPKPLTLEELKERDGKPVWCVSGQGGGGCYCLVSVRQNECVDNDYGAWDFNLYEMSGTGAHGLHLLGWLAYDREPKEDADGTEKD